jgi:hypothetical protein
MDLLSRRYASPFFLLEESIRTGRMVEFIVFMIDEINHDTEEDTLWQIYLHKVFDKTYQEFVNEAKRKSVPDEPVDFETAIKETVGILDGFVPE